METFLFVLVLIVVGTISVILIADLFKKKRSAEMQKLANEFGLSFENSMNKFYLFEPKGYKRNIINGSIKGKNVKIHDEIKPFMNDDGVVIFTGAIRKSETVIFVDDKKIDFYGGNNRFAKLSEIKSAINKI